MNQTLRKRHRRMIALVAVVTPLVFAMALVTRPTPVKMSAIPVGSGNNMAADAVRLADATFSLDGTELAVQTFRGSDGTSIRLAPRAGRAIGGADVLVYWHNGNASGDVVPDDAWLVGTLAGPQARTFELPERAQNGELLFYSLAQQRLYDERLVLSE